MAEEVPTSPKASGTGEQALDRDPNELSARTRRILQTSGAKKINDEDYLTAREGWKIFRESKLGGGKCSTYFKAASAKGQEMAVRILPFSQLSLKVKNNLLNSSVNIIRYLMDNPSEYIVNGYEVYLLPQKLYFFCEIMKGDLESYVKKHKLKEDDIKMWVQQIIAGMQYLYENAIGHRAITAANIVLTEQKQAKITDFTYAMVTWDPDSATPVLGEKEKEYHHHFAPEVMKGEYDVHLADNFALGCIVVNLLIRKHAFDKKTTEFVDTFKKHFRRSDVPISQSLECFLVRCFAPTSERASIVELASHHWITGAGSGQSKEGH